MRRPLTLIASLIILVGMSRQAAAQQPASAAPPPAKPSAAPGGSTAKAAAEALFEEGRRLRAEGKLDEACPKFAESQRLDPGGGTLLNLALCHEAQGRTATAWAEFNEALALALRDHYENREKLARDHIAKLQPDLKRLAVSPGANARVAGLILRVDGVAVGETVWGSPTPVDPGEHVIEASAPQYRDGRWTVTVEKNAPRLDFEVPALEEKPPEAPPPQVIAPEAPMSSGRRIAMYGAFTAAAVGVAGGSLFAVLAIGKKSDSTALCVASTSNPDVCTGPSRQDAVHLNNVSLTDSWVSTAAFGVGAIGAAVGAYLLLAKPRPSAPTAALRIVPQLGPRASGVTFIQSW